MILGWGAALFLMAYFCIMLPIARAEDFDNVKMYCYDFRFAKLEEGVLYVGLKYLGGCEPKHVFELTRDKDLAEGKVLQLYLYHKTFHDKCTAVVHTQRRFDLKKIISKEKPSAIQINDPGILIDL